jgi:glycerol-3-phosphate acyltransferase PlsY
MSLEVIFIYWVLQLLAAYLIGSIPFGVILTRLAGAGDLRAIGSGNIGATNVLRTGRKGLAAATLLLDLLKGSAAVWLAGLIGHGDEAAMGVAAVLGHLYPVWLGFRGGKGVATLMGVVVAWGWPLGLTYAIIWLGALFVGRISSLAGMLAAVSAPVSALLFGPAHLVPFALFLAVLVVWRHRENIQRLIRGEEPRIGQSKPVA